MASKDDVVLPPFATASLTSRARKVGAAQEESILGSACTVRAQGATQVAGFTEQAAKKDANALQGTILEIRRLWLPPLSSSPMQASALPAAGQPSTFVSPVAVKTEAADKLVLGDTADELVVHCRPSSTCITAAIEEKRSTEEESGCDGPLYAYVRLKDRDHRNGGWFALDRVDLAHSASTTAATTRAPDTGSDGRASRVTRAPVLSSVYTEITPGMARTQRAEKQLDYLEERLLRDCKSPTTVRYFVYLGRFVFAPWYYAPYGLLHPEYDPCALVPCATSTTPSPPPPSSSLPTPTAATVVTNPYIRDAYLCPFSLRIYSTFDQLRYETQAYRGGGGRRLCPPGREIYRDERRHFSLFEVQGSQQVTYCRHLFLLGKSFLENKLAGHDVHNYVFYVFCLHHSYFPHYVDDCDAMYFAGYFSWEKQVAECNLACIVTLPCFASGRPRGGGGGAAARTASCHDTSAPPSDGVALRNIGQFMIAASYALAYRRGQVGSPEKPLSDLGAIAYMHYWQNVLLRWMSRQLPRLRGGGVDDTAPHPTPGQKRRRDDGDGEDQGAEARQQRAVVVVDVEANNDVDAEGRIDTKDCEARVTRTSRADMSSATPPRCFTAIVVRPDEEEPQTTVRDIAKEVGLEEADVLKVLLTMGLLHRSAENRTLRLVIPAEYVEWACKRLDALQGSLRHAVFDPALLQQQQQPTQTRRSAANTLSSSRNSQVNR